MNHSVRADRHRLDPLLAPSSVAIVGASARTGSVGNDILRTMLECGYAGDLHLVNPRYQEIEGMACVPSIGDLAQPPDLAILGVGAGRMQASLSAVIDAGVRSAVVFDACAGAGADGRPLLPAIRGLVEESGIPVCGGNGMGFIDVPGQCHASFYPGRQLKPGGITLIAHSGSVFTVLAFNDQRFRFNLLVSPGQELGASVDEYITAALVRDDTRVIAVFMEQARNPESFLAALQSARQQGIPVVICKAGRTGESARLAQSHSGALAGSDAAFSAVLRECGAISVDTVDQLMNTALLLSQGRQYDHADTAFVTDSGGLREALIDRAHSLNVSLAEFSGETRDALKSVLPKPLVVSNPVDCAGSLVDDFEQVFEDVLGIVGEADEVGLVGYEADLQDDYCYSERLKELAFRLPILTDKPCFAYTSFSRTNNTRLGSELADLNIALINGLDETLYAVSQVGNWYRNQPRSRPKLARGQIQTAAAWRQRIGKDCWVGEQQALELAGAFQLPVISSFLCNSQDDVTGAAKQTGYPVVVKTAVEGIAHKSDVSGVVLGITDEAELIRTWHDLDARLGSSVVVQPMADQGIELAFGFTRDKDFGALVTVSAGGKMIELMDDVATALAPFDQEVAAQMIGELKIHSLLSGHRGDDRADLSAASDCLSRFSGLAAACSDFISEMDLNPVLVYADGVRVVDALVVTRTDP